VLRQWIRKNCISYTFIQNELVPDPDFLKTHKIKLDPVVVDPSVGPARQSKRKPY